MSTPLQIFQAKIGVSPDGSFGPKTLKAAAAYFKMTPAQAAHFFGQCGHESAEFTVFVENLNYSASGLAKVFPKYFPTKELCNAYARKPVLIASRVYANRMGNAGPESQDGWRFRGRGAIQLTGKNNYKQFDAALKNSADVLQNPDLVATLFAFESALFFFSKNNLWGVASNMSDNAIKVLTKSINGGYNGLAHRAELTKKYYSWLTK